MIDFNTLELQTDPRGFATLWLSREEKNNAFNAEMIRELILALDAVQSDASLRFLVLRGRGKHFSAGADLAWMQQSAELDYNTNLDDARHLAELMYNLAKLKMPTLAVVQGAAYGGALGLISACDMAIGTDDAQFCLSEVRIGIAPAVISPFVVQAIGERAARLAALGHLVLIENLQPVVVNALLVEQRDVLGCAVVTGQQLDVVLLDADCLLDNPVVLARDSLVEEAVPL